MVAAVLLLLGAGLIGYGLWELRRCLAELATAEPEYLAAASRLADMVADLDEAAAAVDRRTADLEALLARADERIAALRQALAPGMEAAPAPAPREAVAGMPPDRSAGAAALQPDPVTPGPEAGPADPAPSAGEAGSGPAPERADPPGPAAGTLADRVAALADQGLGEEAIAARLGITRGEVRLALGIRGLRSGGGPRAKAEAGAEEGGGR